LDHAPAALPPRRGRVARKCRLDRLRRTSAAEGVYKIPASITQAA